MGLATILMALMLACGLAAGGALAALGQGAIAVQGLLLGVIASLLLLLTYIATDRLADRRGGRVARMSALAYALVPMLVLVGLQIAASHMLVHNTALSAAWLYAVAAGPATAVAAAASRSRATVWSIRSYAGHISAALLVGVVALGNAPGVAVGWLCLLPAILPGSVAYLMARADPIAVATVRI